MFKSVTLEVVGDQRLACESCERRVERLLKRLEGVSQVRARATDQHIEVLFDSTRMDDMAIAEQLREAGYDTKVSGSAAIQ